MFGTGKTRLTELLYAEESMICEAISIQYWSVTDRQKDGHNCHTIIARQHCYADAR